MRRFIAAISIAVVLSACSNNEQELMSKEYVQENLEVGIAAQQIEELLGSPDATGTVSDQDVWLYDGEADGYAVSFDAVNVDAFASGVVDYQLYVNFVEGNAYRYSFIYKKDDELWQYQILPEGHDDINNKVATLTTKEDDN